MENIQQQVFQQNILIRQDTPQEPQQLDKQQDQFQQELSKCDQEMQRRLSTNQIVKLHVIKDVAMQIVNERRNDITVDQESGDKLEAIKQIITNNRVKSMIKLFREQWTSALNELLKRIEFTFELEQWIDYNQVADYTLTSESILKKLQETFQLVHKHSQKEKKSDNGISQIKEINSFLTAIEVKLIGFYSSKQFREYELMNEYYEEYQELNESLNAIVIAKFKSDYKQLWKQIQDTLSMCSESLKLTIEDQMVSDAIAFADDIHQLMRSKCEFQKRIKVQYVQFLQDEFGISDDIHDLFYLEQLEQLQLTIDQLYSQQIASAKKSTIQSFNIQFEQLMNLLTKQGLIITQPCFSSMNQAQIANMICYIIYYTPVRDISEKNLMQSILDYTLHLIPSFEQNQLLVQIQYMISDDYHMYNTVKQQIINVIREGAAKQIQFLLSCNQTQLFSIMTQLYMIISNIKVDFNSKIIQIQPYYGYLQTIRYELLKSFNKHFSQHHLASFYNYLDTYFENRLIYQLGTYSQGYNIARNSGYTIKFQDFHQDYDILHLLRTEISKQSLDYEVQVKQKFNNALKYLKIEQVKTPLPSLFHLVKVSDENIRSRNIIIAVSGFTSQDEDKQIKWSQVANLYPNSEIYALEYESQTLNQLFDHFKSSAVTSLLLPGGKIFKALQFIVQQVVDNPFKAAFTQAKLTGLYLAHFLFKGNLFPNCSISFIGFSLGTQVIASCLHEYKKLLAYNNPSVISSVVLMGGVVDRNYIKNNHVLDVVQHRVFNCYTNKDQILKYILRLTHFNSQPIGLQPIDYHKFHGFSKVVDLDFSTQINGHLPFMQNIPTVLYKVDFGSEFFTEENEKKLLFQQIN